VATETVAERSAQTTLLKPRLAHVHCGRAGAHLHAHAQRPAPWPTWSGTSAKADKPW